MLIWKEYVYNKAALSLKSGMVYISSLLKCEMLQQTLIDAQIDFIN